MKKAYEVTFY